MTAHAPQPPHRALLTAGRWGSGEDASATLRARRQLGPTLHIAQEQVCVVGQLTDASTSLWLRASMTALPGRGQRRLLGGTSLGGSTLGGSTLTSAVRMVRPLGLSPGLWRAPAMVTLAGVTDLVKVDVTVSIGCDASLRPSIDITLTMRGDARVFGMSRSRRWAGPLDLTVRASLSEPPSGSSGDTQPWAYAA